VKLIASCIHVGTPVLLSPYAKSVRTSSVGCGNETFSFTKASCCVLVLEAHLTDRMKKCGFYKLAVLHMLVIVPRSW
jgi:hypothetical protein